VTKPLTSKESAFVNWLLLTDAQRLATSQPATQQAWGDLHGVPDRTLRSWKSKPHVAAEIDKRRLQLAAQVSSDAGLSPTAMDVGVSPEILLATMATTAGGSTGVEAEYAAARQMLLSLVSKGDKNALDLWFKTFGKPFVEAEQAAFKSDFRELSNDELAARTAALLPDAVLTAELARRQAAGSLPAQADGEQA
jgi:hypothetical protein